jgi:hypothetical protein
VRDSNSVSVSPRKKHVQIYAFLNQTSAGSLLANSNSVSAVLCAAGGGHVPKQG